MKKLLMALLLTFVLAFTYSCSDTAGDPSSGEPDDNDGEIVNPEPEPEPEPDDEIVETGKEWGNIKFLDDVQLPAPDGITVVDKFVVSTAQGTETVTQTEAIINEYTYDQFKTYVNSLKAIGVLYENKTHSKIVHILGGDSALLPDTLEDDQSTYFVFDYDTHYAIVTFYGDTYTSEREATDIHNLSIKLTKIDPFSNIGGKVKVMKDVIWTDIKFNEGAELPTPAGDKADLVIYDNATDKQEMYIDIKTLEVSKYKSYLKLIQNDTDNFTRHRAIPSSAATGIQGVPPFADGATTSKTATWVVTDKLNRYISLAYIGTNSPSYTDTHFKITINSKDPFAKGSGSKVSGLSMADAIARITPLTRFPELDIITNLGATGKVVTFDDTKYGQEIRFKVEDNDSNYTKFRDYLRTKKNVGLIYNPYKNKTHKKVPLPNSFLYEAALGVAFKEAVPTTRTDTVTGAWSFIDGEETDGVYISFIWHGKDSPNNPYPDPESGKAIFIIERMSSDPMWFMP